MAASRQINVEDRQFYRLITLSYKLSPIVLREIIRQYHTRIGISFEVLLNNNCHALFHKRQNTTRCCKPGCQDKLMKIILDHQWNALFSEVKGSGSHKSHTNQTCSEVFKAKPGITPDVCDVSLACLLITNIQNLAVDTFSLLNSSTATLYAFLLKQQHVIFHSKENRKCCQCTANPSAKKTISQVEWDSLYFESAAACPSRVCSCRYKPLTGISLPHVTMTYPDLISKLLQLAGPVIVVRSIRNEVLAHSTNGTLGNLQFEESWKSLTDGLLELLDICSDQAFKDDTVTEITDLKTCVIDGQMLEEFKTIVNQWISDMLEAKCELQEVKKDLQNIKLDLQTHQDQHVTKQEFTKTQQSLLSTVQEQKMTKQEMDKTQWSLFVTAEEQKITKQELVKTQQNLASTIKEQTMTKRELEKTKQSLLSTSKEQKMTKQELENIQQNLAMASKEQQVTKTKLENVQQQHQHEIEDLRNPIPHTVRELFIEELKQWEKEDQKFVDTRASVDIMKAIHASNYVVLTGSSGNGKSFTKRHVALQLQKREGYDIIPFLPDRPSDIIKYRIKGRKQVFVIDDMCGKNALNVKSLEEWSSKSDLISNLIKTNNQRTEEGQTDDNNNNEVKLLISSRLQVYKKPRFQSALRFLCKNERNLLSDDLSLLPEEKNLMMKAYFPPNISKDYEKSNLQKYDFFPLLCKLANDKSRTDITTLFKDPIESIKNDIKELQHHPYGHCALILCILFDKGFTTDWLIPKLTPPAVQTIVSEVCNECDINRSEASRNRLREHLSVLENTYMKKVGNTYSIIHDKVFDIVTSLFGNDSFECFVKFAPSSFIGERYIFKSVMGCADTGRIIVPEYQEDFYFNRLVDDLRKGDTYSTFHNKQLSHDLYRHRFIEFCTQNNTEMSICFRNIYEAALVDTGINITGKTQSKAIPLIEAVVEGYSDIVAMLLDMNCDVNQTDVDEQSSLFLASKLGHIHIIQLLLNAKANLYLCNRNGQSPLLIACHYSHLHDCAGKHTEMVSLLLQHGAEVTQCDKYGRSPLYTASAGGHTEIVSLLLQHGAYVTQYDKYDSSPLNAASAGGHTEIVSLLLQHGADVSQCDMLGMSPLYTASLLEHTEIVSLLLQHGADVTQGTEHNKSPLYAASGGGHTEIVSLLLQHGADVSQCDMLGMSPLYAASNGGHTESVSLLLQHGADVTQCNKLGKSPLYAASNGGHTESVSLLLKQGADVTQCNMLGMSPLYAASEGGHTEIVSLLLQH